MQYVLDVTIATVVNGKKMGNRSIVQYPSYHHVQFHLNTQHIERDFMGGGAKWPLEFSFLYTTFFCGVKFQSDYGD